MNPWLKGLLAGFISGAANGILTGMAASGIAPEAFNFHAHIGSLFAIAGVASLVGALIGVAAYLKQSPLPGVKV